MLCKEYEKICTGNSWNLDQRLASGGHWQWLYSEHCWLRRLGCQQVAHKVSGGGGNEDKLPVSIKCSQKARVSNNLWQCALVYIHKMKAACLTDHIKNVHHSVQEKQLLIYSSTCSVNYGKRLQ